MASLVRRNFRRDTEKLTYILKFLSLEKLSRLSNFADCYRNREVDFNLDGFLVGVRHDIVSFSWGENFTEFSRILKVYEARTSRLRLLSLLNDALRLALLAKVPPPSEIPAIVPNLNDPMTKRVLNGMTP